MAGKNRSSVSVTRASYDALRAFATARGVSGSSLIEHAISALTSGTLGAPTAKPALSRYPVAKPAAPVALTIDELARRLVDALTRAEGLGLRDTPRAGSGRAPRRDPACSECGATGHKRTTCPGFAARPATPVPMQRIGLCADCIKQKHVRRVDWNSDGHLLDICEDCETGKLDSNARISYGVRR